MADLFAFERTEAALATLDRVVLAATVHADLPRVAAPITARLCRAGATLKRMGQRAASRACACIAAEAIAARRVRNAVAADRTGGGVNARFSDTSAATIAT